MASKKPFTERENAKLRSALEELMRARGWGQRGAALELGVTQQLISNFLAGRSGAGFALANEIAKGVGRVLEDLLTSEDVSAIDLTPSFAERLDRALAVVFTHKLHSMHELDAVRAAMRGVRATEVSDERLECLALEWLNSAARLLEDGLEVTVSSLLFDLTGTYADLLVESVDRLAKLQQENAVTVSALASVQDEAEARAKNERSQQLR